MDKDSMCCPFLFGRDVIAITSVGRRRLEYRTVCPAIRTCHGERTPRSGRPTITGNSGWRLAVGHSKRDCKPELMLREKCPQQTIRSPVSLVSYKPPTANHHHLSTPISAQPSRSPASARARGHWRHAVSSRLWRGRRNDQASRGGRSEYARRVRRASRGRPYRSHR